MKSKPPKNVDMDQELRGHGFFLKLSDSLPLDRNATDNRLELCKDVVYDLASLPSTSVVMVFHNEALSTLLRSIHSVLNRTPPQLLHEIILVDDGSTKEHLHQPLEDYIKLLPKTRLTRLPQRSGLVKARLRGAQEARASTFTVLDSHIEVQDGWLEPLMARIKDDPTRVLMPNVDSINARTFEYEQGGIGCTLGMLWNLVEHSIEVPFFMHLSFLHTSILSSCIYFSSCIYPFPLPPSVMHRVMFSPLCLAWWSLSRPRLKTRLSGRRPLTPSAHPPWQEGSSQPTVSFSGTLEGTTPSLGSGAQRTSNSLLGYGRSDLAQETCIF